MSTDMNVSKEIVRDKLTNCEPLLVMGPCTYEDAVKIIESDPNKYDCYLFPIIRENKNDSGKIVSRSVDLYVYTIKAGTLELVEKSEDEYNLNGDLINEAKNT